MQGAVRVLFSAGGQRQKGEAVPRTILYDVVVSSGEVLRAL
jgi:hypothetical protein